MLSAEEWVALAVGGESCPHRFARLVHVIDGVMYATDRYRMHWAATKFPDGAYDPTTFMRVEYRHHVPDLSKLTRTEKPLKVIDPAALVKCWEGCETLEFFKTPDGRGVNPMFLREAMNGETCPYLAYETEGRVRFFGMSELGNFCIQEIVN